MFSNMSVTIKTFFDKFDDLVQNLQFGADDNVIEAINSILNLSLLKQLPENTLAQKSEVCLLLEDTVIKKETLSDTLSVFDDVVFKWKFCANFQALINDEEESNLFIELLIIYDNFWLVKTKDFIKERELLSNLPKTSPFYSLVNRLEKWEKITAILQNELEKKWIDVIKNPIIKVYEDVQLFMYEFRFMLIWLINWSINVHWSTDTKVN